MDQDVKSIGQDSVAQTKWLAIARAAAGTAGLLLLTILAAFMAQEQSALKQYRTAGVLQSEFSAVVTATGDSVRTFSVVKPVDFPSGVYPQAGDTIIWIGAERATPDVWRSYFHRVLPPDTQIVLTVSGPQGVHDFVVRTAVERAASYFMLTLIDVLRFLIALGFIGVGLWAFFAQPNSTPVRIFAWFCFTMTAAMIAGVSVMPTYYASFRIPGLNGARQALGVFALGIPVLWLHLQFVFPRILRFVRRHRGWVYPVIYAPWAVAVIAAALASGKWMDVSLADTIATVSLAPLLVWLILGFVILFRRFRNTSDRIEKRQLRLILWGTGIGIGGFLALILLLNVFSGWFSGNTMRTLGAIVIGFSMLLFTPISYAYAFGRYRLLEVQGRVKRGTRYLLTSSIVLVVFLGLVYVIGEYALSALGVSGRMPTMALALLLAFGISPARRRLQAEVERRFYPERRKLRDKLEQALEGSSSLGSRKAFLEKFSEQVRESLHVEAVQPVLAGENGGGFLCGNARPTPFTHQSDFLTRIVRERRPVFVDEVVASGKTQVLEEELEWLSGNKVAVVLPLMTQQRLAGFLALGYKTDREDYAPEEISILTNLAPQVALASENLRLLEENVEKRRLEEQMQMARRIQEGFLPQVLPDTIGLEIATHNRFSLDVAGDYFDVMSLPDGQTLVAIADVSGKGAGAALLMANLQASLRTTVEVGIPLTKSIAQVNNLIFRNTPPEQYITFVAVRFDPRENELCFVNAGHNPPLLVRADGKVEELPPTGLILGAIPDVQYEKMHVAFNPGDLLVLYTDGVSEAMNDAEEEYGDRRIRELAAKLRHETVARIIDEIEQDVERFCGRVPMEDDSTMVVVKRI
ncbi:SpoIIE family protein phosphatase [bacterium]|nr:SpoIIE family protein phosphatase [bacterium]